ncbi:MAG: hypothetical protein K2J25_07170, partial [Oscillospiraceae bacterium]|nr:hypothetical protein [Oscillospiraceae bacterium]
VNIVLEILKGSKIMHGIVNWFVLSNIFGNDFQFTNALIEYVRSEPLSGDISMEFVISNKVINPPAKWKQWDKVYVKIDFSFVRKLYYRIKNKQFMIQTFAIRTQEQAFCMEIRDRNCNIIEFEFEAARIQNVKPLIYNEEYGRYEVC